MNTLEKLLLSAYERYPLSQAEDYYKLIHQSSFGPRHLLHSTKMMKDFFMQEWDTLVFNSETNQSETVILEDISLSHSLARIHFVAAIRKGIKPESIFDAFLVTLSKFQPISTASFQEILIKSRMILIQKPFSFSKDSIDQVWQNGITDPPNSVHHSVLFNTTYQPHYRIVIPSLLTEK